MFDSVMQSILLLLCFYQFSIVKQSIQNITMDSTPAYLKCPTHTSEYLQLVCQHCSHNSLACPLCLDSEHRLHQIISLKKFMVEEIPKLYTQKQKPEPESLSKDIKMLGSSFKQSIQKLRKQIGHEINQLEAYFEDRNERILQQLLFICGKYNTTNLQANIEATKQMIKLQCKIPTPDTLKSKLTQIQQKVNMKVNDACLEIRRIIYNIKCIHSQAMSILLNSKSFSDFKFSESNKHSSIHLSTDKTIATNKNFDNVYHSCAVMPTLSPFRNSITFKVRKSDHKCVWLGVADLKILQNCKYQNAYKCDGPNYWIWEAGDDENAQIYAQNVQSLILDWNFQKGDTITLSILYEGNKKTLQIMKNMDKQTTFSMAIDPQIGQYFACISLGDENESICIVNEP